MKKITMILAAFLTLMTLMTGCDTSDKAPPALALESNTENDAQSATNAPAQAQPPQLTLPKLPGSQPSATPQPANTQGGAQGAENASGYGYGETVAFPSGTSW